MTSSRVSILWARQSDLLPFRPRRQSVSPTAQPTSAQGQLSPLRRRSALVPQGHDRHAPAMTSATSGMTGVRDGQLYRPSHKDMKSSPFFGLGIGVEHGRWLRFDVTGEYRGKYLFVGQDSYHMVRAALARVTAAPTNIRPTSRAGSASSTPTSISARGRGSRLTSAAASVWRRSRLTGFKDVNVPNNGVAYGADDTSTNFAWALYAGMSYDVTDRVHRSISAIATSISVTPRPAPSPPMTVRSPAPAWTSTTSSRTTSCSTFATGSSIRSFSCR